MTLSDLSNLTGIPAQTINRYELGQRAPKIDTAVQIADALRINPLWLQGYDVPIEDKLTPAMESELIPPGYDKLNSTNRAIIDRLIADLAKGQSSD